jgi:MATE family multidrug resistance protein
MAHSSKIEFKTLLRLSVHAILTQLALMSMTMIDIIMAGRHSELTISAVSVGTNILHPMIVIMFGLFVSLNPLAAQYNAKNDHKSLSNVAVVGVVIALVMSIPYCFILFNSEFIFSMLDVNPVLVPLIKDYLIAVSYGLPFFFIFLALRFFNDGLFSSKKVLKASLLVFPVNMGLNWVLMYGKFGFEPMGVVGLGYSTATAWALLAAIMFKETLKHPQVKLLTQTPLAEYIKTFKLIFKTGTPIAFSISLELIMLASIGLFIGQMDVTTVAAHQISMSLCFIFLMMPLGVATAITARIGYFYSQSNQQGLKDAKRMGLLTAFALAIISAIALIVFATSLTSIYTNEARVIDIATGILVLVAVIQIPAGMLYAAAGYLRGVKDVSFAVYVYLLAYWIIGLPLGYLLANRQEMGVQGYWIGLLLANIVAALCMLYRTFWGPRAHCVAESPSPSVVA